MTILQRLEHVMKNFGDVENLFSYPVGSGAPDRAWHDGYLFSMRCLVTECLGACSKTETNLLYDSYER